MAKSNINAYEMQTPPGYTPTAVTGFPLNSGNRAPPGDWSTGLCGCFGDCCNCFTTWCCPCITFGQIADIVDRGSPSCGASGALYSLICLLTGCQFLYACTYRTKLRGIYNIEGGSCPDCCVHYFCHFCALCQEYRELKNRGFEMSIGWNANMERQGNVVVQPPVVQGGMMR